MKHPIRTGSFASLLMALSFAAACTTVPAPTQTSPSLAAPRATFSQARLDEVLARFVDDRGRVDYAGLSRDALVLDAYYAELAGASPDSHPDLFATEDARLAYWINAYNASAIETVLYHYPIESVKDVRSSALFFLPKLSGFFLLQRVELGGEKTNLYDLENKLIRKRFSEPRVHFALNCASISCPRLPRRAFHAETLQDELETETYRFVSEERNVDIDPDDGEITLSSIFDWYEDDFTEWMKANQPDRPATLLGYIEPYLTAHQAALLARCGDCEIEFAEYDWGLNDQRSGADDAGDDDGD